MVDRYGNYSTFTYEMQRVRCIFLSLVWLGILQLIGCTSVLDRLAHDDYAHSYLSEGTPEALIVPLEERPALIHTPLDRHEARVAKYTAGRWVVVGNCEFNTASSPRPNHLDRLAQKVGATLVIHSKQYDRREQDIVTRREYEPGQRVTVNGNTVQLDGRWVDRVEVVTRVYHTYRASLLREK